MVRLQTLDLRIGVRVPASQPPVAIARNLRQILKSGLFLRQLLICPLILNLGEALLLELTYTTE